MTSVEKLVTSLRDNPHNVAYNDLHKVCEHHFGPPRQSGTSHSVFKKAYQVRQVLAAIDKKEAR